MTLSRRDRVAQYPRSMNGLVALIYGIVARADAESLPRLIEMMADVQKVEGDGALPLSELTSFGFELLIRKALNEGLQEAFRGSEAYADYVHSRDADGVR